LQGSRNGDACTLQLSPPHRLCMPDPSESITPTNVQHTISNQSSAAQNKALPLLSPKAEPHFTTTLRPFNASKPAPAK